ncbi:MAG: SdpI family protein [Clostridia bacterium]|nr:SdpI family protein [Clostridia bacterium]
MIKKNIKILIITSIVILLPIIAGVVLWNKLPDKVPIHWNINNEVDRYASKTFFVFFMPLIFLAMHWFCVVVTTLDPKNQNHQDKMLVLVFWLIPLINLVLSTITYFTTLGIGVEMGIIMPLFLGFIFLVLGNYLPKCKQNYTIGIKIAYTLNSEENWNKTHRFAGWVWTICGFIIMLTSFLNTWWILLVVLLIMAIAPLIYSFILYKKGV